MIAISDSVSLRDLDTTVTSTTEGLFGLTKYPAKFIPQVVNYSLQHSSTLQASDSASKHCVTDPFAGVGTVGISAHLHNAGSQLWDINPLLEHYQNAHRRVLATNHLSMEKLAWNLEQRLRALKPLEPNTDFTSDVLDYLRSWYHPAVFQMVLSFWHVYWTSEPAEQGLLLIPLLRVTNKWSYNDLQRQKLCRSQRKQDQIDAKLSDRNWGNKLLDEMAGQLRDALARYALHAARAPWEFDPLVQIMPTGDDVAKPVGVGDIVVTSPPYMQAQEYIRSSKLSLLWLGHSFDEIRLRMKMEIPYGLPAATQTVQSAMYVHLQRYYERNGDSRALQVLVSYFTNVIEALERASANAREIYLFVGRAGLHGTSIPIDVVIAEHFQSLGWTHKATLADRIVSKTLFTTAVNPATKRPDVRMNTEQLVMLAR